MRFYFNIQAWSPSKFDLFKAFKCIQKEERERIKKFYFKEDFKSALIGRLLIRKIISDKFCLKNNEIKLSRNENNKPIFILNEENTDNQIFNKNLKESFDFNISHQGDFCVAIGENVEKLGVDVMKIEKRSDNLKEYLSKMKTKFTENEWSFINVNDEEKCLKNFLRLWTLKESYVKAISLGLTTDISCLDFNCLTELKKDIIVVDTFLKINNQILKDWSFHEYYLNQNHVLSIAYNQKFVYPKKFNEIEFDELISSLNDLENDVDCDNLWSIYEKKSIKTKKF